MKAREAARRDYVMAYPGETVDQVTRKMIRQNAESVVVVERNGVPKPIGVASVADILRLRRWVMEEEDTVAGGLDPQAAAKAS